MSAADIHRGRRPRWVTLPLQALLVSVILVDGWGTLFWARVGGPLGTALAAAGAFVAVVLCVVLGWDIRRQWFRPRATSYEETGDRATGTTNEVRPQSVTAAVDRPATSPDVPLYPAT